MKIHFFGIREFFFSRLINNTDQIIGIIILAKNSWGARKVREGAREARERHRRENAPFQSMERSARYVKRFDGVVGLRRIMVDLSVVGSPATAAERAADEEDEGEEEAEGAEDWLRAAMTSCEPSLFLR